MSDMLDQPPEQESPLPPQAQPPQNIAFVLNIRRLVGCDRFTLAPGFELRRATAEEIPAIKRNLGRAVGLMLPLWNSYWEMELPYNGVIGAEADWRYFVIAFTGSNERIADIQSAFDLCPADLEIGFTLLRDMPRGGEGMVCHPGRLFQMFHSAMGISPDFFADVSAADFDFVARICAQLGTHDPALVNVKRLASQVGDLKSLPYRSPMRFLGYFAILESLLAHKPDPTDKYESITRQVKMKIILLNHRWPARLDYGPFAGLAPDKIWTKMYEYRSLLAHGAAVDFTRGSLSPLGNHERAMALVKETVKAVVRHALEEPRLLLDLRDC